MLSLLSREILNNQSIQSGGSARVAPEGGGGELVPRSRSSIYDFMNQLVRNSAQISPILDMDTIGTRQEILDKVRTLAEITAVAGVAGEAASKKEE